MTSTGRHRRPRGPWLIGITLSVLVMACGQANDDDTRTRAEPAAPVDGAGGEFDVEMTDRHGHSIGSVVFGAMPEGTRVQVSLAGVRMEPGFRGFHLHETAVCEPDHPEAPFTSAGDHWNPGGDVHGHHGGDMPPLLVTGGASADASFVTDRFTLGDLPPGGVAVILHEAPDNLGHIPDRYHSEEADRPGPDEETLDTGDAGGRYACGTLTAAADPSDG